MLGLNLKQSMHPNLKRYKYYMQVYVAYFKLYWQFSSY